MALKNKEQTLKKAPNDWDCKHPKTEKKTNIKEPKMKWH